MSKEEDGDLIDFKKKMISLNSNVIDSGNNLSVVVRRDLYLLRHCQCG